MFRNARFPAVGVQRRFESCIAQSELALSNAAIDATAASVIASSLTRDETEGNVFEGDHPAQYDYAETACPNLTFAVTYVVRHKNCDCLLHSFLSAND